MQNHILKHSISSGITPQVRGRGAEIVPESRESDSSAFRAKRKEEIELYPSIVSFRVHLPNSELTEDCAILAPRSNTYTISIDILMMSHELQRMRKIQDIPFPPVECILHD